MESEAFKEEIPPGKLNLMVCLSNFCHVKVLHVQLLIFLKRRTKITTNRSHILNINIYSHLILSIHTVKSQV